MVKQIINNIKSFVELTTNDEEEFIKIIEIRKYVKKEFIFKEGQVCDRIFFFNKGCLRTFINIEGEEKTVQFFFAENWFTDYNSFLTGLSTIENLQTIEPATVVSFNKSDLHKLYSTNPVFEKVSRIMTENAFMLLTKFNLMKANQHPEERYLNLLKQRPELVERIPQHYIASYLGVQPQSLSRIRKRIFKRNK